MRLRQNWLITVPALLLLAFLLLRVAHHTYMYSDETLVYDFTRLDLSYTVNYLAMQDVHPPLWFSFFWLWRHLVGDGEFAGRMQALLFSLMTLALTYRIGRDWFTKARFGLFSLAILGVSAYFLTYALDIRPYALVMLLSAFSMWVFMRWMRRGTWRYAIAYGVITAIMFYVHYFVAFLVIAQTIYFLLSRPSRRLFVQGIGAAMLAFILWLPWLPSFLHQVSSLRQLAQEAGEAYGLGIGTPATTQATNIATILKLVELATNGQLWLYALALTLGAALLWRKRLYWLTLLWALGVPAIALALNTVAAVYTQRYVVYLTIGLALALGAALATLRRWQARDLAVTVFVIVNLILLPGWLPVRVPYRDLYQQVSAMGKSGDAVLTLPAIQFDQFIQWQQGKYLSPELQAGSTTEVQQAMRARRIWFLTGDWFNPDVRAAFDRLEPDYPVQQVIGQCDRAWCYLVQLMEAPPLQSPERFGADMDFWGVDVDSVSRAAIQTRLWWRVEQVPDMDYSMSLRLLDASGTLVAQKDGPIVHYGVDTVQTSQLEAGQIYIDHRTLDLPSGLVPEDYHLALVVYQPWDGVRLILSDGADTLLLETITVP